MQYLCGLNFVRINIYGHAVQCPTSPTLSLLLHMGTLADTALRIAHPIVQTEYDAKSRIMSHRNRTSELY